MFKKPWLRSAKIISDEGYSVSWGREWLKYETASKSMSVTIDNGGSVVVIFTDTIARWNEDPSLPVDQGTRDDVLLKVTKALEWDGITVQVTP